MIDFTILNEGHCFGFNRLDIFEKRESKAIITDFSILLGGTFWEKKEGKLGVYWTNGDYGYGDKRATCVDGASYAYIHFNSRVAGARIVLPISDVSKIPSNGESMHKAEDGVLEVEYGYYPQKAASKQCQEKLEIAYQSRKIKKTRNSYTTDSRKYNAYNEKFLAKRYEEYEFEEKRYVRVKANSRYDGNQFITLSNGEKYQEGDNVWIEVLPVKWWVDEKEHIMLTEKVIFAGVRFDKESYYRKDFDKREIKIFIDKYFSRDLVQTRTIRRTDRTKKNKITKIKSR